MVNMEPAFLSCPRFDVRTAFTTLRRCAPITMLMAIICLIVAMPSVLKAENEAGHQGPTIASPRDFIEKNLNGYRERLRELKESYNVRYGSLLASASPTDIETIAKNLPKPTTLRLAVLYPEEEKLGDEKIKIENGEYFIENIHGNVKAGPLFNLTGGLSALKDGEKPLVSADPISMQLLGMPQKVNLYMLGDIYWTSSERSYKQGKNGEKCCKKAEKEQYCERRSSSQPNKCLKTAYREVCSQYAPLPVSGYALGDPRFYAGQLGLVFEKGPGLDLDDKSFKITFTGPGKKSLRIVSPRKYSKDEQHKVYTDCIPKYSYAYGGLKAEKAVIGYKPAGMVSADLDFTAVMFKRFGFPGFEIDASSGKVPDLDYFYDLKAAEVQHSFRGTPVGVLSPMVLLDYGDAGGLKAVRASDVKAPVTWSVISPGPFSINEGNVSYSGGIGATKFRVTLGGYESVENSLTANAIDVSLDASLERGVVSPGKRHKAMVQVKGPADLSGYQVKWSGEGGSWAQGATTFKNAGDVWQAENSFSVSSEGPYSTAKTGKTVKILIDVVRMADSSVIYAYTNPNLATTYPAIDKLELYAAVDGESPEKVTGPVDMFITADTKKVVISPRVLLGDGKHYEIKDVNPRASVEITSSDPGVIVLANDKKRDPSGRELPGVDVAASPGDRIGTSKVTARLGGRDIDAGEVAQFTGDREELRSEPVEINVNNVFIIGESGPGGRTTYRLTVMGPSDMTKYQANWTGETKRTTPFRSDTGGFVSTLETTLRMDKVEIQKSGSVVAWFDLKKSVWHMNIKLVPSNPPVTIVKKVALSDPGSLETITQCKNSLSRQMELFGFDPGMEPEKYCRAEREKEKKDILSQREGQKAFNNMLREINRQGQDLVIMSDTMRVGAMVRGDLVMMQDDPFCHWTLENGGTLSLQSIVTPVEKIAPNEGACFNVVKNLKNGFNPDTVIKVNLIMLSKTGAPVVAKDGRLVTTYDSSVAR